MYIVNTSLVISNKNKPLNKVAAVPLYMLLIPPSLYNFLAQSMGPAYLASELVIVAC